SFEGSDLTLAPSKMTIPLDIAGRTSDKGPDDFSSPTQGNRSFGNLSQLPINEAQGAVTDRQLVLPVRIVRIGRRQALGNAVTIEVALERLVDLTLLYQHVANLGQ